MVSVAAAAAFCWSDATSVSSGTLAQALEQRGAQVVELVEVGVGHRVLVLRARQPAADVDVLRRLHEQIDALQLRQLGAQARDDLDRRWQCGPRPWV